VRTGPLLLLTFCFLFFLSHSEAATEIPFEYREGLIWLSVSATGRAEPLRFLLDSGAGVSVIDLRAARALGAKLGPTQAVLGVGGRSAAYGVGGIEVRLASVPLPHPALAIDLTPVSAACRRRIDGLLGADFFRAHLVQIDFRGKKIRLLSREEFSRNHGDTLPLVTRGDALCVRVSVNGQRPAWVRVDTGCDSALEWVTRSHGPETLTGTTIAAGPGSRHRVLTTVRLGALQLDAVPTGLRATPLFPGEAGLLGNGLLGKFTVTFDTAKGRLLLARN